MSGLLLAMDTSTSWAGVALYDGTVRLELNWRAERHHSEQLMPMVERALELVGAERADLGSVAVARGPGSYTGVRVGITVARVLAFALGIPSIGVDSLEVLAQPHHAYGLPVRPVLDAGRRRYATALHVPRDGGLERVGAIQSVNDEQLVQLVTDRTVLCGDLSAEAREMLAARAGDLAVLPPPSDMVRRSAALAEIAWQRWRAGDECAFNTDPIYVTSDHS